jgi:hypothetical protein
MCGCQRFKRAIRKVTSDELLIKQAKLLLNVLTAEIEALVVSVNKFLHACVKEVCRLSAQPRFDTFHQLIIVEVL